MDSLASALQRRMKMKPPLELADDSQPVQGQESYDAAMKDRQAPGQPQPAESPLVKIDVEGGEAPEVELGEQQEDPKLANMAHMQMLGMDQMSDADKAQLMGDQQPSSLTGKVRRAMLMKQQGQ